VDSWTHRRLAGRRVVLEPLEERHREPLFAAAGDPRIFRWYPTDMSGRDAFDRWFDAAFADLTFVTHVGGEVVGSSRYMNLVPEHRRLEIGNTWLVPAQWQTGTNVEAKLLMLAYAFEQLGVRRVEFKTDALNERSRAALAALPARFEGVHRQHMLVRGGENRDSAWYSVLDAEWPDVRAALRRRLESS
jgi:RimJ/RimL family protein N-acetyltransferase